METVNHTTLFLSPSPMETTTTPPLNPPDPTLFTYPTPFTLTLLLLVYTPLLLTSLILNTAAIFTLTMTTRKFRTSIPNLFLTNLAAADLVTAILNLPFSAIELLWQRWPFGPFLCHVMPAVRAVGVFVSSWTLVALAIDRHSAITNPIRPPSWTRGRAKGVVLGVWFGAVVAAVPVLVFTRYEVHEGSGFGRCGEYGWTSPWQEFLYSFLLLWLQFLLPVTILGYTFWRIIIEVRRNQRNLLKQDGDHGNNGSSDGWIILRRMNSNCSGSQEQQKDGNKRKKLPILSLTVITCYTVCYAPHNILYILYAFGPGEWVDSVGFPYFYVLSHALAMSHGVVNPVVYFWVNRKFREGFRGWFRGWFRGRGGGGRGKGGVVLVVKNRKNRKNNETVRVVV